MLNSIKSRLGTSFKRLLSTPASTAGDAASEADTDRSPPVTNVPRRIADQASRARRQQRLQLRLMRHDLEVLLQQHADSRRLMRHLSLVERTLRKDGLLAVEALPRPIVDKALLQLESLVQDWSPEGLAGLRSRLAVMLRDRPPTADTGPAGHRLVDDDQMAQLGHGLVVTVDAAQISDTDHAAFAEMERSWVGRTPSTPATRGASGAGRNEA